MDNTALTLCMDNDLPIIVFDMNVDGNIRRAVRGEPIGTTVSGPGRAGRRGERNEMSATDDVIAGIESKMQKTIEATRADFASVRTGRASPALLDRLMVEQYGAMVPIKQVASVSTPDARSLQVSAFDRQAVGAIRKAIETSDLGLSPNIDGSTIRLSIPQLTEQRRKDLVKIVRKKAEDGKVAIRGIRHKSVDEMKALLKANTITEDENKRAGDRVQKLTDKYIKGHRRARRRQGEGDHGGLTSAIERDPSVHTAETSDVTLLDETDARAAFAGRALELHVLTPPYPALGRGRLRVLRALDRGAYVEIVAGYDAYVRLPR